MLAAAPSQSPTALAYPTAGSNDPFTASFYANQAALQFSEENLLADDQRATRQANNSYEYNRGLNARQEPLALTKNRNAANTQGLAESGVLAKQQGQTQTAYAEKQGRLGETRRNAIEKYQQSESTAKANYALGTNKNVVAEQERQLKEAQANPPQPTGATPANPGGLRTVTGPPEGSGIVPYTESSRAGSVAVGSATRAAREARERAARKATVG
jgi:hypothetical protein